MVKLLQAGWSFVFPPSEEQADLIVKQAHQILAVLNPPAFRKRGGVGRQTSKPGSFPECGGFRSTLRMKDEQVFSFGGSRLGGGAFFTIEKQRGHNIRGKVAPADLVPLTLQVGPTIRCEGKTHIPGSDGPMIRGFARRWSRPWFHPDR